MSTYRKDSLSDKEKEAIREACEILKVKLAHSRLGISDKTGFDQMTRIYKAFYVEKMGISAVNREAKLSANGASVTIGKVIDKASSLL